MTRQAASHLDQTETGLVARLYPQLRSFASVVARAGEDPNDLVQEALVRTLRAGPLSRLDYPKAYLRTTIYHLAVSARRHWTAEHNALVQVVPDVEPPEDPWQVEELLRLPPKDWTSMRSPNDATVPPSTIDSLRCGRVAVACVQ